MQNLENKGIWFVQRLHFFLTSRLRGWREVLSDRKQVLCGAAPDGEQDDGGSDQGDKEAEPEAGGSEVGAKGEKDAERKADDPVAGEMGEERSDGVAGSAQGAVSMRASASIA